MAPINKNKTARGQEFVLKHAESGAVRKCVAVEATCHFWFHKSYRRISVSSSQIIFSYHPLDCQCKFKSRRLSDGDAKS